MRIVTLCADSWCSSSPVIVGAYRDHTRLTQDGVDAWLNKEKPCGERSRTILPGQGFDTATPVNLPDWELEIRKA